MGKIEKYKVGELVVNFDRKRKPLSARQREKMKGVYPYYGAACIFDYINDYIFDGEYILLGEDGTVINSDGTPVLQRISGKTWVNNHAHVLRNSEIIDFDYLYYVLKNANFSGAVTGAVQPKISQANMNEVEVEIYEDKEDQKKVAGILKSLDEKIELNNEINNNLMQQAKTIFEAEIVNRTELPNGWKKSNLASIADYLNGIAMQNYRPTDDDQGFPVLKIKELRQGACDADSERCSSYIKSNYIVNDGDVIFSWSGSLLVDFWCGGICGLNQHLFKVTSTQYAPWFFYSWTNYHLAKFAAIASAKATTMGHIKRSDIEAAEVVIPSSADYQRIGASIQPLYDLCILLRLENRKLAATRDSLLPRLLSGDIDISEAII